MPKYPDIKVYLTNCDGNADDIIHKLHTSPRQFYRYLDIAYMNPDKVNEILSGKLKINVNDLFRITKKTDIITLINNACLFLSFVIFYQIYLEK